MFNLKEKRELQKKILIKKTMNNMERYCAKLESQKGLYKQAAIKAKKIGSASQLSLALSGYKSASAQELRAQEMLLNFQLTSQMKDLSRMTLEFLNGMSVLSKDMAKITKNTDFLKVQTQFENAMQGMEESSEKMDVFLDASNTTFSQYANKASGEMDGELNKIIDAEMSAEDSSIDEEIDKALRNIDNSLKSSSEGQ